MLKDLGLDIWNVDERELECTHSAKLPGTPHVVWSWHVCHLGRLAVNFKAPDIIKEP